MNGTGVIEKLNDAGYEAYFVGGCVRDMLMNREPKDIDITTNATPDQIKTVFEGHSIYEVGAKFGTIGVDGVYEITTYRTETTGRHPEVAFCGSLIEDLSRRDFTMNAIAFDGEEFIDPFNGKQDIADNIIRCVGNPEDRFKEDPLRILRAIRFMYQFNHTFVLENSVAKAIVNTAYLLETLSAERVRDELIKSINNSPSSLFDMYEFGVTDFILPEFDCMVGFDQPNNYHCYDVAMHTVKAMENTHGIMRLVALFHDFGKPGVFEDGHFYNHAELSYKITVDIMKRLKFDNDTIKYVSAVVRHHGDLFNVSSKRHIRKLLNKIGPDIFEGILAFRYADIYSQSDYKRDEKLEKQANVIKKYNEIIDEQECFTRKNLLVNGNDIHALGFVGKDIGTVLDILLNKVLDNQELNNRAILIELAKACKDCGNEVVAQ